MHHNIYECQLIGILMGIRKKCAQQYIQRNVATTRRMSGRMFIVLIHFVNS